MQCKFKVGDWVKIRDDIELGHYYGGSDKYGYTYDEETDKILKNKKLLISLVDNSDASYKVTINGIMFDRYLAEDMFVKTRKPTKAELNEEDKKEIMEDFAEAVEQNTQKFEQAMNSFDKINDNLNKMIKKMNERTLYDESLQDKVIDKVKAISINDIMVNIENNVDKYIKNNYGMLPKKIEIKTDTHYKDIVGLFHNKFEQILKIVDKGVPLMLTGPAGAGKNHTLEQVAEALELEFYFTNAVTQEFKLTGFIDANGVYQETQFYKAFKDGGLFFLDEVDASCPESLIILNSAIANGYFDFPNGRVNVNEKFRVVCAGNTYGTGADMIYVGRNTLDGATLDRFATIEFDYDEDIERQLAYDEELFNFIKALRKAIKENSLRYIVSMRATINATKLLEIGMSKKEILRSVIIKNMQIDDLNTIINKINDSSEWKTELERLKNVRN